MFTYSRGCHENFSNEANEDPLKLFLGSKVGAWYKENKEKITKKILQKGIYEMGFEKVEDKEEFEEGKLSITVPSSSKVLDSNGKETSENFAASLKLEYEKTVDDETSEEEMVFDLKIANEENGIYSINGAPRRFITSYVDNENDKKYYFVFFKFRPDYPKEEIDLKNLSPEKLDGLIGSGKLNAYMVANLEYKPQYGLFIFLIIFFVVLIGFSIFLALR